MKPEFQRGDYVKGVAGPFKGKRGWVARVSHEQACVVWKGVWDHGIWTFLEELKRTRRPRAKE